jgi:hypothetical protein
MAERCTRFCAVHAVIFAEIFVTEKDKEVL